MGKLILVTALTVLSGYSVLALAQQELSFSPMVSSTSGREVAVCNSRICTETRCTYGGCDCIQYWESPALRLFKLNDGKIRITRAGNLSEVLIEAPLKITKINHFITAEIGNKGRSAGLTMDISKRSELPVSPPQKLWSHYDFRSLNGAADLLETGTTCEIYEDLGFPDSLD